MRHPLIVLAIGGRLAQIFGLPCAMKSRIIWLVVVCAAMAGFYYTTIKPLLQPTTPRLNRRIIREFQTPEIPQVSPPEVTIPRISLPLVRLPAFIVSERRELTPGSPVVPIQDRATIDFSFGAPAVRAQTEDQAAMDKALKEMNEAVKDITFEPKEKK